MVEVEIDERPTRVGVLIARSNRRGAARTLNLDALVPLLLFDGAAVDFEVNVVVFDDDVADARSPGLEAVPQRDIIC